MEGIPTAAWYTGTEADDFCADDITDTPCDRTIHVTVARTAVGCTITGVQHVDGDPTYSIRTSQSSIWSHYFNSGNFLKK